MLAVASYDARATKYSSCRRKQHPTRGSHTPSLGFGVLLAVGGMDWHVAFFGNAYWLDLEFLLAPGPLLLLGIMHGRYSPVGDDKTLVSPAVRPLVAACCIIGALLARHFGCICFPALIGEYGTPETLVNPCDFVLVFGYPMLTPFSNSICTSQRSQSCTLAAKPVLEFLCCRIARF